MKHSSRRILALLLALSLCIGMMPMSIFAEPETEAINEQSEEKIELSQSETDDSADLEEESEGVDVFETDAKGAPEAAKKADVRVLKEKKVDLEKVEEDAPLEAVKKAEMPAVEMQNIEDLKKADAPALETAGAEALDAVSDQPAVKLAANATADVLMAAEKSATEDPVTINLKFYKEYNGPEGSGYKPAQITEGETIASVLPSIMPWVTKEGYEFMFWAGYGFTSEGPYDYIDKPITRGIAEHTWLNSEHTAELYTISLLAIWGHVVEYEIDGEKITDFKISNTASQIDKDGNYIVKHGSSAMQPNIIRDGYVAEWIGPFEITENRTVENGNAIQGHWVKLHTVSFIDDDEAGTSLRDPQTVKDGEYAKEPKDPQKDGFIFDGWFLTGENGESVEYFVDGEAIQPVTGDITLVAHWTEKTKYTVSFYDENGVKIEDADQSVYDGGFAKPHDMSQMIMKASC